jgi:hypothetical protein
MTDGTVWRWRWSCSCRETGRIDLLSGKSDLYVISHFLRLVLFLCLVVLWFSPSSFLVYKMRENGLKSDAGFELLAQ